MRSTSKTCWLLLATLAAIPAFAASGSVLDPDGKPIAGARACLWNETNIGFCVDTDALGNYRFPDTRVPSVRITARGFLPEIVAAVHQSSPIVLRRAASLLVHVVDSVSGAPIEDGTVTLTYFSGRALDGFPFNRSGVRVATLEPGTVLVRASAEGFATVETETVILSAGHEVEVTLRMRRQP